MSNSYQYAAVERGLNLVKNKKKLRWLNYYGSSRAEDSERLLPCRKKVRCGSDDRLERI